MNKTEYLTFDDVGIVPAYSEIASRSTIDLTTKISNYALLGCPIISSPMDTVTEVEMALKLAEFGALGALHRFTSIDKRVEWVSELVVEISEAIPICASIGVTGNYLKDAEALLEAGTSLLLLDVAHGHHKLVGDAIKNIKSQFGGECDIMAGSVSTPEGCKFLEDSGADCIRFGQGNGSLCETRIRTGIGIPQISGLLESCKVVQIPIIADGGIRYIGDIAKALAAGASAVMLGSLLAGTKETPGDIARVGQWPNEQLYKKYMGAASLEAKQSRGETKNVEGNSKTIPYKGKVERIINDIQDGLRSACSYVGANNLNEFKTKANLIRVSAAGAIEATPHLL
jgi:IMP dehydrogenase